MVPALCQSHVHLVVVHLVVVHLETGTALCQSQAILVACMPTRSVCTSRRHVRSDTSSRQSKMILSQRLVELSRNSTLGEESLRDFFLFFRINFV